MKKRLILALLPIFTCVASCGGNNPVEFADKIIYGNIVTLDDNDTVAKAIAIKDGKILKVGKEKEDIKSFKGPKTAEVDYGQENYIYPGFLDSHTHTMFAGNRAIGQANVSSVVPPNKDEYKKIIKDFIDKHPEKDKYLATGWVEVQDPQNVIDKDFLDSICNEKPLVLNTCAGHSILCNTKALQYFDIDQEAIKKWGTDLIRVDAQGNPTGYLCENPAIEILGKFKTSVAEAKDYILWFQDFAFQNGFTAVSDAGTELMSPNAVPAYVELQNENKLKMRTYSYMLVKDNVDDPKGKIEEIANFRKDNSGEYFNVVGAKVFLDGVLEARTAWTLEDYIDKPDEHYHGLERFNNKEKMVELITEASKNNLAVHSHSIGDGATRFFMDCVAESQKTTHDKDQRNAASHLQFVSSEDVEKFADTNTIAVTAPLWVAKTDASKVEINYVGEEKYKTTYPIKSFVNKGVKTAFHSDYPVSPMFNAPLSIYMANQRCIPEIPDTPLTPGGIGGSSTRNNETESISRKDAVLSMTKNVAYMWHQEDRLGSLEVGKIANMTIFDGDLINGDVELLPFTSVIATIVDGEEVYRAEEIKPEDEIGRAHV